MIDLGTGRCGRVALRGLNSRDLELQEEFGHLDAKVPTDRADTGLGCEVDVELFLEGGEVGVAQRRGRRKLVESELQRRLGGRGEVDRRERYTAREDVWYA